MSKYRSIDYKEEYGKINCPEGFLDELKSLSIEKQVERYRWTWSKVRSEEYPSYFETLKDRVTRPDEKTVIMMDGVVVGFYRYTSEQYIKDHYILPFQSVYYDSSDNNGAGYKECEAYHTLICW